MNGEKVSITNANFDYKSFIGTEFSHGNDAKKTWLTCQGYFYEDNPSGIDGANGRAEDVAERKRIVAVPSEFRLFGKIACDFLPFVKHLNNGATIRLSLRQSPNDFVIMSEQPNKHYQVQTTDANLYLRKMTEMKTRAKYNYIEIRSRTFFGHKRFAKLAIRRRFCQRASSSNDFGNELEYSIPGN